MSDTSRRILTRIIRDSEVQSYVGRDGEIFYDIDNPQLKVSDGSTPGGLSLGVGTDISINTTGIITAAAFVGDGSGLTNLPGGGGGGGSGESYWVANEAGIHTTSSVGIGTTNPKSKLHVDGTIRVGNPSDNYDNGATGIATASVQIFGTENFNSLPYSGQRITTGNGIGTVTSIPSNLLGPVGVASTLPFNGGNDDGYWDLTIPFNIEFSGITTDKVYVGTNSYLTFTDGFGNYGNLSFSNPAGPKILISAGDRYGVRIYTDTIGSEPNRTYFVRYEALSPYSLGYAPSFSTNNLMIVWEATFYENEPSQIDIQIAQNYANSDYKDPNVNLVLDGVLAFENRNIRIGDATTGKNLISEDSGLVTYAPYASGTHNIFMGVGAGSSTTDGSHNNFLGYYSGFSNTSGRYNNFFGCMTGVSNINGNNNNFFGPFSGLNNTTGSNNNFFGVNAGCYNTAGYDNNFFGFNAGFCNTYGNCNNFFGRAAGFFNTSGSSNNFLGREAGNSNTSGSNNIFIGQLSGISNTTGCNNIFLGNYSGQSTIASDKIILGRGYGFNNYFDSPDTTKDTQFAVGVRTDTNASKYWLVGDENFNVGIGTTNPQYKLDVGGDLNFTGTLYQDGVEFSGGGGGAFSYCCTNNITSTDLTSHPDIDGACHNFFAGVGAGSSITSGSRNNFLGYYAGYCNTTGCQNNFFGPAAGLNNTTGSYNNFFGVRAGCSNIGGLQNNFIGYYAGRYNTTGNNNNFFGSYAGRFNTSGCNNNFFGNYIGISTSASSKVILGHGIYNNPFDTPDTTKSTQFAVGLRTDSNPSKYWLVGDENFNIGIGTTNPTTKLQVGGDVKVGVNTSEGVILTSPDGTAYRIIVNNGGTLTTVAV